MLQLTNNRPLHTFMHDKRAFLADKLAQSNTITERLKEVYDNAITPFKSGQHDGVLVLFTQNWRTASRLIIKLSLTMSNSVYCFSPVQRQLISAVFVSSLTTQAGLQPDFVAFKLASYHQVLEFSL